MPLKVSLLKQEPRKYVVTCKDYIFEKVSFRRINKTKDSKKIHSIVYVLHSQILIKLISIVYVKRRKKGKDNRLLLFCDQEGIFCV